MAKKIKMKIKEIAPRIKEIKPATKASDSSKKIKTLEQDVQKVEESQSKSAQVPTLRTNLATLAQNSEPIVREIPLEEKDENTRPAIRYESNASTPRGTYTTTSSNSQEHGYEPSISSETQNSRRPATSLLNSRDSLDTTNAPPSLLGTQTQDLSSPSQSHADSERRHYDLSSEEKNKLRTKRNADWRY